MNSFSTTKRILAVMAVTTALCADQAVMASPAARPQVVEIGQIASRLVNRLAGKFQRDLPAVIREPLRQQPTTQPSVARVETITASPAIHSPLSPFQFRLPPPAV